MLNWNKRHIGVVALLLCALALPAMAQLDTGSIVGVVRDKSGAVVPGANVKATSIKTGRVNEVKAGSAGEYEVLGVPEGTYRVEVSHSGFKTGVVSGIVLNATDTRNVDVTLNMGSTTVPVPSSADMTTLHTATSERCASSD